MEDVLELPESRTLFRQSSVETRVEAQAPSPVSSESEDDDGSPVKRSATDTAPRVIDVQLKYSWTAALNESKPLQETPNATLTNEGREEKKKSISDVKGVKQWTSILQDTPNATLENEGREEKDVKEVKQSTSILQDTPNATLENEGREEKDVNEVKQSMLLLQDTPNATLENEGREEKDVKEVKQLMSILQDTHNATLKNEERGEKDKPISDVEEAKQLTSMLDKNDSVEMRAKELVEAASVDRQSHVGTLRGLAHKGKQGKGTTGTMASPRPKSPRPPVTRKDEKEESFWEKIGTLGRKKRIKEVQEVQEEGKHAIDSPGSPTAPDLPPEEYALEENEERSMIEPRSFDDPRLRELIAVLIEWINDELAEQRIIVKDIEEDLYDGQVLQKLLEKLSDQKLDVPEVTQSEEGQKQKLGIVLAAANRVLGHPRWSQQKWSVESVHSKNLVAILHLLVALARHYRAPVRLPENVSLEVVVVQKREGSLSHRTVREEITSTYDELGMRCERDAFDTLFDHAPDKLQVVKKSLVTFVNKHLNKVNLEVNDLDTQFHDGVYLTILMGLLEGFFVPLYSFHLTPQDFDQKVHNVAFAFELMQDVGIAKPKARPEDIVNLDLKSTLRVLYNLFTKYKSMS